MPNLIIKLDAAGAFADFAGLTVHHETESFTVALVERGMESGAPSVCIGAALGNGEAVLLETSLALFLTAADAFRARFGDPRDANPLPPPKRLQ